MPSRRPILPFDRRGCDHQINFLKIIMSIFNVNKRIITVVSSLVIPISFTEVPG
jgi:hypothetical protein